MENTNDINNPIQSQVEPEIKNKMTQAQKDCQKRYLQLENRKIY